MESAASRVFAIPELLDEILRYLPINQRDREWPDIDLQRLKGVNRSFRDVLAIPGELNRRVLQGHAIQFGYWGVPDFLTGRNVLPLMDGQEERKEHGYLSEYHRMYQFRTQNVWLNVPEGWGCPVGPKNSWIMESQWKGIANDRFTHLEATWRKMPLHPTMQIQAILGVVLFDHERRLDDNMEEDEMVYHFYSGGGHERMSLGELYGLLESIRQYTTVQHLWMYRQALALRAARREAHLAALESVGDHTHSGLPNRQLGFLGSQGRSGERCDLCERAWHNAPPAECQRCLISDCTYAGLVSISWPMDWELFHKVKGVAQ